MKVEQYTEAIRDVERRIQKAEEQDELELPEMAQPQGAPPVFEDHLALMLDLQLLAFQTDLTRVISFMLGKEQSARPYPQIGVPEAHHPLSHHNDNPELIAHMSKINRYHTELFAKYLAKLRATPDGDGSLLDHMTILYGSGISNSTRHSGDNLPLLVVGGGAGKLKGGRHLKFTDKPSMANLLVTLMDKMDVPVDRIGGSRQVEGLHDCEVRSGASADVRLADRDLLGVIVDRTRPAMCVRVRKRRAGDGSTPLHWAAYQRRLRKGRVSSFARAQTSTPQTISAPPPLWAASLNGSLTMVRAPARCAAPIRTPRSCPARRRSWRRRAPASRGRRAAPRKGRESGRAGDARTDRADVGGRAEARRRGRRCSSPAAPMFTRAPTSGAR